MFAVVIIRQAVDRARASKCVLSALCCLTAGADDEAGQVFSAIGAASHLPLSNGMEPAAAIAFAADGSIAAEQPANDGGNWGQQLQQWDGRPAADPGAAATADGGFWDGSQYQQTDVPDGSQQWQQEAAPLTEVCHMTSSA